MIKKENINFFLLYLVLLHFAFSSSRLLPCLYLVSSSLLSVAPSTKEKVKLSSEAPSRDKISMHKHTRAQQQIGGYFMKEEIESRRGLFLIVLLDSLPLLQPLRGVIGISSQYFFFFSQCSSSLTLLFSLFSWSIRSSLPFYLFLFSSIPIVAARLFFCVCVNASSLSFSSILLFTSVFSIQVILSSCLSRPESNATLLESEQVE